MSHRHARGTVLLGRYRLLRELGAGAHGRVYLAEDLGHGGHRVAVKVISGFVGRDDPSRKASMVLRTLRHPCWASVLDGGVLPTAEGEDVADFLVLRYVDGTPVQTSQGPQPIEDVWQFLEDGARILRALHERGVIHYDVTTDNVLREEHDGRTRFVLTDGGLAHIGPIPGGGRGTPQFMAPELTAIGDHDHRVDLYSLGLVAYHMLAGEPPFKGRGGALFKARRDRAAPSISAARPDTPAALAELIDQLIERDPVRRPASAQAIIERLHGVHGPRVPLFREDEILRMAGEGAFKGRARERARVDEILTHLAARVSTDSQQAPTSTPIPTPVRIVAGVQGMGATSLIRDAAWAARDRGIPVVALAPTRGARDRRGLLRQVVDGIAHLGLAKDEEARPLRLDAGRGRTTSLTQASDRASEVFLRAVESAAERQPLLITVEAFDELEADVQGAVRILARHLASRAEYSGRTPQPAVALLIDAGEADTQPFLIPDTAEPERAVWNLTALTQDDVTALVRDRLPGLTLDDEDLTRLMERTEGVPGAVASALGEAARRGHLAHIAGQWRWDLRDLSAYDINPSLPPDLRQLVRRLSTNQRDLVRTLDLLATPVPAKGLAQLARALESAPLPRELTLTRNGDDGDITVTLAHRAIATELRGIRPAEMRRIADRLRRSRARWCSMGRAAILGAAGQPARALEAWLKLPEPARARLAKQAPEWTESVCASSSVTDATPVLRAVIESGIYTRSLARFAANYADLLGLSENAIRGLVENAQRRVQSSTVLLLTRSFLHGSPDDAPLTALLLAYRELAFNERGESAEAKRTHARLRKSVRILRRKGALETATRIEYLLLIGRRLFMRGHSKLARHMLEEAARCARRGRERFRLARVLSNLAIICSRDPDTSLSLRAWKRSAVFREALGDLSGLTSVFHNMGNFLHSRGDAFGAVPHLQKAAAIAVRHCLSTRYHRALERLAAVFDDHGNTRLAHEHARRSLVAARVVDMRAAEARSLALLAPLSAALGQVAEARQCISQLSASAIGRLDAVHRDLARASASLAPLHMGAVEESATVWSTHPPSAASVNTPRHTNLLLHALARVHEGSNAPAYAHVPVLSDSQRPLMQALGKSGGALSAALEIQHSRQLVGGHTRRMVSELLLAAWRNGERAESLPTALAHMVARHRQAGERLLEARCMMAQATLHQSEKDALSLTQRALRLLNTLPQDSPIYCPQEARISIGTVGSRALSTAWTLRDLGSVLAATGSTDSTQPADSRLADAMRAAVSAATRTRASGKLEELLDDVVASTITITGAERACVVLRDEETEKKVHVASSASDQEGDESIESVSQAVLDRVLAGGEALLLHDVFEDEELLGRPSITSLSLRSILCVPIVGPRGVLGAIYADNASSAGSFDNVDREVLAAFAEHAAAAIQTNQLVRDLQRTNADVRKAQEQLIRGERLRTIGEVSSGVAHEFNNLLTAILARVQLMHLSALPPELRKDLELIEKASLDAAAVVRRLQSFSRNQRQGHFRELQMGEIVADALELLRPLWSSRAQKVPTKTNIKVALDAEVGCAVRGDPTELREVITNLIKNALDAVGSTGQIDVSVKRTDTHIEARVADNGTGIPPDVLPRIFDPFFTTKGEKGTGLGLPLIHQIVERHGGAIAVEQTGLEGTTFLVRLPLSGLELGAEGLDVDTTDEASQQPGPRVLVVDDDANVREPLCTYLTRTGFEVTSAVDGEDAIRVLEQDAPDVVISDVSMPHMDGIELCRKLQKRGSPVPVVLMSGWASGFRPAHARRVGAAAVLSKPFAMKQVTDLLRSVVEG